MHHVSASRWTVASALATIAVILTLGAGALSAAAQNGAAVSIVDFAFQPAAVEVAAGSTVTWSNTGAAPHTVTADDGSFDSGRLAPGASFSQTFTAPGTFTYHCAIHPQMTGTITVTGGDAQPATQPTQAEQVPRTGVGTMASEHAPFLAVAAAIAAALLGVGAWVADRRA